MTQDFDRGLDRARELGWIASGAGAAGGTTVRNRTTSPSHQMREQACKEISLGQTEDEESIFRHMPSLITRCTADLRYRAVSSAYARMLWRRPEEIIGRRIVEVMGPKGFDTIQPYIERVLAGEEVEYETHVHFEHVGNRLLHVTYVPERDDAGKVQGWVASMTDITEKEQAELAALRLAAIVETSDDAIVTKDLNGIITSWNKGAERLFGYTADEVIGKPINILIPPDRSDEEPSMLERLRKGQHIDHYETVRMCRDGRLIDISLSVSPLVNAEGKIIGASKIARDITERRRAAAAQEMLIKEMSHRLKNAFAVVNGIVGLSAGSCLTPESLAQKIRERLTALALAHDLTRPGLVGAETRSPAPTTLHSLTRAIFAPYLEVSNSGRDRLFIEGIDLPVAQNSMTSLALLLHEFATNAVKYGPLSVPHGFVKVGWQLVEGNVLLTWREKGGPPLNGPPDQQGFGSTLARQIVMGHFGGELAYDWNKDGLIIRVTVPKERLATGEQRVH